MKPVAPAVQSLLLTLATVASGGAPARAQEPQEAAFAEREVTFEAADGAVLAGVLLAPDGEGSFSGAVIIQGSGTSDRTNYWARSIAEALAGGGVTTLLPDKRGSGRSEGDWRTASFETLAGDALAGVALVRKQPGVDRDAVGLVGLSQGGHVAPLAASLSDDVGWVVDISGATVPVMEQIRHELRNTGEQADLSASDIAEILEIQRLAEAYLETGEWEPYARALEAARERPSADVAAGFPQTPDSPVWTWARLNGRYDPIPYWQHLDVPVLVVYGEEDEKDNVPVAESVERLRSALSASGHRDYTIRVFPGSGHALWDPASSPHAPRLREDFLDLLISWIGERTRSRE